MSARGASGEADDVPADGPESAVRLGVVSFLNTLPLIDGLERLADVRLRFTVPSGLLDLLLEDAVDVALCSSIDYQRSPEPLLILPVGLLGCDGETLTVRLYSSVPIERIRTVHCDTDSHSSVVLMRILLKDTWGIEPELVEYDAREHVAGNRPLEWPETVLLIGDKVVTDSPPAIRYPHQLDLGALWRNRTGAPFVFAAWMAKRVTPTRVLRVAAAVLDRQRRYNRSRIETIIHERAIPRTWPADLARVYLERYLAYAFTPPRLEGMELFFDKAFEHGFVARRRPVELLDPTRSEALTPQPT